MSILEQKLHSREAVIGVVGLGYVGLPLLMRLSEAGYPVVGFDISASHVARLNKGQSPFNHIPDSAVQALMARDTTLTCDMAASAKVDAVILCVPTPLNRYREPDLSYVVDSLESVKPYLHADMLVSLESTTWPGTTDEVLQPIIEDAGFTVGKDIYLVYSPEREDPGNAHFNLQQIPKVVGGVTEACLAHGVSLYGSIVDTAVPVSSTRAAELTKLLENIQRSVNIGLMNEMKVIAKHMDIDIFEVINAAATKPFGFSPYFPGPGLGGHCIPIDPFYLTWKVREYGLHTRFIELSGEINTRMPEYVVGGLITELSTQCGKAIRDAKILLVGLAYKKNVNDIRESPCFAIMELLKKHQAVFDYHDPHVPEIPMTREHAEFAGIQSTAIDSGKTYDAAIIVTDHDSLDYAAIARIAPLIIDTRGKAKAAAPADTNICIY